MAAYTMILFVSLTLALTFDYGESVGCNTLNRAGAGTCITLMQCPPIDAMIKQRKPIREIVAMYSQCGFQGRDVLICCPDRDLVTTTIASTTRRGIRKSETACTGYKTRIAGFGEPVVPQIFFGVEAAAYEFPHMAALGTGGTFDCGGTVISPRYVLTAAHCVIKTDNKPPTVARIGVNVISSAQPDNDYAVERITVHPQYNRSIKYHDLALLRLSRDVVFDDSRKPACLYTDTKDPTGEITVSGWGTTENDTTNFSDVLLKATLRITPNTECNQKYTVQANRRLPSGIISGQLCAKGGSNNSDTCQGDSGGPIQFYDYDVKLHRLIGVTSFGRTCGGSTPGVYVRVANYLDWIEGIVWP